MSKIFVNEDNTKSRPSGEYGDTIRKIAQDGVCPFCSEHLKKYHPKPVAEKIFWLVTDSNWPYKPVLHHRLIIHKTHISHINEISPEAWAELLEIMKEETKKLAIAGGTLMLRFGDTHFTGGSVTHLHAHIIQSDPENPTYDKQSGLITRVG